MDQDDEGRDLIEEVRPLLGVLASQGQNAVSMHDEFMRVLRAADVEGGGPDMRIKDFPLGHAFPARKPNGGAWRSPDGTRLAERYRCEGIIKRGWLHKHLALLPACALLVADVDLALPPPAWAARENAIVSEMQRLVNALALHDVSVVVVLLRHARLASLANASSSSSQQQQQPSSPERESTASERAFALRRRCELDAKHVHVLFPADLAPASPVVRRLARQLREAALSYFSSATARLRRWEKILVPTRALNRPLLVRVYFKLGVYSQLQANPDRTVTCLQEALTLLAELQLAAAGGGGGGASSVAGADDNTSAYSGGSVHSRGVGSVGSNNYDNFGQLADAATAAAAAAADETRLPRPGSVSSSIVPLTTAAAAAAASSSSLSGAIAASSSSAGLVQPPAAALWGQIKGSAEAANMRLVRHYLGATGSAAAAIAQFRWLLAAFGAPPPPAAVAAGARLAWHHRWLARQYLEFGEVLTEHLSRFPLAEGSAAPLGHRDGGYSDPGYYYLGAATHTARRRRAAEAMAASLAAAGVTAETAAEWVGGLATREPTFLGEVRRLDGSCYDVDSEGEAIARRRLEACLDLEEASVRHTDLSTLLLSKALERCPQGVRFARRRCFVAALFADELVAAGRREEALAQLSSVARTYLQDGWLELASAALRKALECAWSLGQAAHLVDASLKLCGRRLSLWVPREEQQRLFMDVATVAAVLGVVGTSTAGRISLPLSFGDFKFDLSTVGAPPGPLELSLDETRPLLRVSGRFSAATSEIGAPLRLRLAVLSLAPLPLHFDSLALRFNHEAVVCVIADDTASAAAKQQALLSSDSGSGLEGETLAEASAAVGTRAIKREAQLATASAAGTNGAQTLTASLLLEPGRLTVYELPLRLRDSLVSLPEPLRLTGAKLTLAKGLPKPPPAVLSKGSSTEEAASSREAALVFSTPVCGDAELQAEEGGRFWEALGSLTLRLTPPVPRASLALIGDASADSAAAAAAGLESSAAGAKPSSAQATALQGALTRLTVLIVANADAIFNGALRLTVVPPPPTASASDAFFWEAAGDGCFKPVALAADRQPETPQRVPDVLPGGQIALEFWIRASSGDEAITVAAQLDYKQGATSAWTVTACTELELMCVPPLTLLAEALPIRYGCEGLEAEGGGGVDASGHAFSAAADGSGGEAAGAAVSAPLPFPAAVGVPLAVRVTLGSPQAEAISVRRVEVALPEGCAARLTSSGSDAAVLFDAAAADGGGSGGPAVLQAGDALAATFCVVAEAAGTIPLGAIRIRWRRDDAGVLTSSAAAASDEAAAAAAAAAASEPISSAANVGLEVVTELPLPPLAAAVPPVRARLDVPAEARVGREFRLSWEISNATGRHHELQLLADGGGDFVWSGRRHCQLQVAPWETVKVGYCLVPLVPGHVPLPRFSIVWERLQASVVRDLGDAGRCIFVCP